LFDQHALRDDVELNAELREKRKNRRKKAK
jgi:hypothetical protein